MEALELVERLAALHIKRARIRELEDFAWKTAREKPELRTVRGKAELYKKANRVLFIEILRIETLLEQEL